MSTQNARQAGVITLPNCYRSAVTKFDLLSKALQIDSGLLTDYNIINSLAFNARSVEGY